MFLGFKERRSIYLLIEPINLLQLFFSQGLVDLLTHSGRCFVELLLESHSFLSRWPALVDENINTLKFGFYIFLTANSKELQTLKSKVQVVCSQEFRGCCQLAAPICLSAFAGFLLFNSPPRIFNM